MMDIILSASDFEVKRETTKQELDETRNISPLNCPAAMFFWKELFFNKSHKHFELKV